MRLPLEFVCFAIMEGKLYKNRGETFVADWVKGMGNQVVYGAVYSLQNEYFHNRTLDAMNNCSLSSLGRNHSLDLQHRVKRSVAPIVFSTIDELRLLKYNELEKIEVELYVANEQHQTVQNRISRTQKFNFRIKNGILREPYEAQYREAYNAEE